MSTNGHDTGHRPQDHRRGLVILTLAISTIILAVLSLLIGQTPISFVDVASGLVGLGDLAEVAIVQEIRLPRALLGIMVGASLGLSGAALQGLLRNPLAEPGVIGVSASAGLGAVIALYFGYAALHALALPLFAIAGAVVATGILFLLSRRDSGVLTLILAGVAITSLAGAMTSLAMNLSPNPWALSEIVFWLFGSLRDRSLADVTLALPFILIGVSMMLTVGRALDALTLGEDAARSLGIDLRRARILVIAGTTLAVGSAVAVAGVIGFVGLIVPHMLRMIVGPRPGGLLLPSMLGGSCLLLAADLAARLLPTGSELYLGVFTSLIGAPFFLHLVVTVRRSET